VRRRCPPVANCRRRSGDAKPGSLKWYGRRRAIGGRRCQWHTEAAAWVRHQRLPGSGRHLVGQLELHRPGARRPMTGVRRRRWIDRRVTGGRDDCLCGGAVVSDGHADAEWSAGGAAKLLRRSVFGTVGRIGLPPDGDRPGTTRLAAITWSSNWSRVVVAAEPPLPSPPRASRHCFEEYEDDRRRRASRHCLEEYEDDRDQGPQPDQPTPVAQQRLVGSWYCVCRHGVRRSRWSVRG
jgi:hypothetical protein